MKKRRNAAVTVLLALLLGGCVSDVGRYQLLSEGPYLYKIDTVTGRVFYRRTSTMAEIDWTELLPLSKQGPQK